jgi:hypothetical protein
MDRRRFIIAGFALTPLAAALSACGKSGAWPEGMAEIKWDRDTCVRCSMVISDRRFAAEMRGGEKNTVFKFDDIGCAVFWMRDKAGDFPWMAEAATRSGSPMPRARATSGLMRARRTIPAGQCRRWAITSARAPTPKRARKALTKCASTCWPKEIA